MRENAKKYDFNSLAKQLLPWLLSLIAVIFLIFTMLFMKGETLLREESVTVRNIKVALPPPPDPPPPLKTQPPEADSPNPTVDLIGPANGPSLSYSSNPKLTMLSLEKIKQPEFDRNSLDLKRTLSVDFPVLEVQELDKIPRLVSSSYVTFPREITARGIKRVATQVEIIIDENGKAFVKKIVDPVYPEMVEVIRKAINNSRFTIPTKNGRPVQAVYLYSLVFINRA